MSDAGFLGFQGPVAGNDPKSLTDFQVAMAMSRMATAMLVQVQAVAPGGVGATGTVTVRQLVHQVDGYGAATPHGDTYNVPYGRLQGGANAVIIDPEVGDIGLAVFASRDISSVKATRAPALPGSARRHDHADALYVPAFLNGTPTQFVQFGPDGITVTSPMKVTINAPTVLVEGDLHSTGAVVAGFGSGDQVTLQGHEHPTASPGGPSAPTAGT